MAKSVDFGLAASGEPARLESILPESYNSNGEHARFESNLPEIWGYLPGTFI